MNGKPDPLPEIESNHQSKYNENNIVLLNAIASWMLWTSSSVSRDLESNGSVRRYKKGYPLLTDFLFHLIRRIQREWQRE